MVGAVGTFALAALRSRRRTEDAQEKSEQLAAQVDRRISELFSLQELSYVLSQSIRWTASWKQVAKYAARFLNADGAIVVLAEGNVLRVVAATGTLEPLLGEVSEDHDSLVRRALGRDRIEVAEGQDTPTVRLIGGMMVRSAAVAPLRAQGIAMGALAVADRQGGPTERGGPLAVLYGGDQASVVLAKQSDYTRWFGGARPSGDGLQRRWRKESPWWDRRERCSGPTGRWPGSRGMPESEWWDETRRDDFGEPEAVAGLIEAAYRGERTAPLVVRPEDSHRVCSDLRRAHGPGQSGGRSSLLIEDVTEQRLLEAQDHQSDKMASIGQLVSGGRHELTTTADFHSRPGELCWSGRPTRSFPERHLPRHYDQAERAGRIVRNLLTFARKGVEEKTAVGPARGRGADFVAHHV